MIFKGNTKMTPALTELLDDTTPSSSKTYSSEKIETLIGGGGGGIVKIAEMEASNLTTLLSKQVNITNVNSQNISFSLKMSDFTFLVPITQSNRHNYYYIFATDYYLFADFQDTTKTGLIELSSGVALGGGENNVFNHDIQPYSYNTLGAIVFQNNLLFKNMGISSVGANRVAYINIYIKKISSDASITPSTINIDLTRSGNSGKAYIFGIPRNDT